MLKLEHAAAGGSVGVGGRGAGQNFVSGCPSAAAAAILSTAAMSAPAHKYT